MAGGEDQGAGRRVRSQREVGGGSFVAEVDEVPGCGLAAGLAALHAQRETIPAWQEGACRHVEARFVAARRDPAEVLAVEVHGEDQRLSAGSAAIQLHASRPGIGGVEINHGGTQAGPQRFRLALPARDEKTVARRVRQVEPAGRGGDHRGVDERNEIADACWRRVVGSPAAGKRRGSQQRKKEWQVGARRSHVGSSESGAGVSSGGGPCLERHWIVSGCVTVGQNGSWRLLASLGRGDYSR